MSKIGHTIYLVIIGALGAGLILSLEQFTSVDNDERISAESRKTIAVLPFVNVDTTDHSANSAVALTSDLTQELIGISGLIVVPVQNVRSFSGQDLTIREIGSRLSASLILEGSVRETLDRVFVTVQLVDAVTDEHLWSNTYDRQFGDLDGIVADVSRSIDAQIRL